MRQNHRMLAVQSPIIPIVAEWTRQCPGTLSLGQGVVAYGPPPQAVERISSFLADQENHKYKPVHGIGPLVYAIEQKLRAENRVESLGRGSRVVVSAGGNMAFNNALLAIADPGDEVILLTPYYFNHEMAITMASCRPVLVPTDEDYQPKVDAIASAITAKTRAIVTVSPNNPTGAVYPEATLRAINALCRENGIYHIHDEAYEYFTHDGAAHFSPGSIADSRDLTISLFSLSKSYGFASWRIGYAVIPDHLFDAVRKIQDTILICPPVISQYAAVGALEAGVAYCREQSKPLRAARTIVAEQLARPKKYCTVAPAGGAFYYFLKLHTDVPAMELTERLIREFRVAVIPGDTFGMAGAGCYLRVSYGSLDAATAADGVERLARGLRSILGGKR
jgi:aspartate/methionine/tyrosine aminotransferase